MVLHIKQHGYVKSFERNFKNLANREILDPRNLSATYTVIRIS